jgi:hypothetical protein
MDLDINNYLSCLYHRPVFPWATKWRLRVDLSMWLSLGVSMSSECYLSLLNDFFWVGLLMSVPFDIAASFHIAAIFRKAGKPS